MYDNFVLVTNSRVGEITSAWIWCSFISTFWIIGNHPNDDAYGDLYYVNTDASSCSEIIVDLINASEGQLKLTTEAAWAASASFLAVTKSWFHWGGRTRQLIRKLMKHKA